MPEGLDPQIVRSAEEAACKPDFPELVARGRTLARRRTATALTAVVVVLGGLAGLTQLPGRQEAVPVLPVVPSPTPTESPLPGRRTATEAKPERPTAQEIVGDSQSVLRDVHVVPGDPDRRVVLWSGSGLGRRTAVVVMDGSNEPIVVDAVWGQVGVRISEKGDVVVASFGARARMDVVGTDGSVRAAQMVPQEGPVTDGEMLGGVGYLRSRRGFWAIDTATARAHLVPVPKDTQNLEQTDGGQLRALTSRGSYAWSDDGGATWTEHDGAVADGMLSDFVTSSDDVHVVVNGGDGATLFPFDQVRRLEDGTWTVVKQGRDPMAYIGHTAVLPDGRFLVTAQAWSDNGRWTGSIKGTLPGLFVSAGEDWSAYERIKTGAPFDEPAFNEPWVTDIDVTDDATTITAFGPDWTTAWTSTDLGVSWSEMRVR